MGDLLRQFERGVDWVAIKAGQARRRAAARAR
jgi:hypothetical protein